MNSLDVLLDTATCFLDTVQGCALVLDGVYGLFVLWSYTHRENEEKNFVCFEPHLQCCVFYLHVFFPTSLTAHLKTFAIVTQSHNFISK